jgi:predicted RNA binding protein YcfA (HicA-like mRNA interferase family)
MKLPRDVSGQQLIRVLEKLGYSVARKNGSHICLVHDGPPRHGVTVPVHNPNKVGTLSAILGDVAIMRSITIESLIDSLR